MKGTDMAIAAPFPAAHRTSVRSAARPSTGTIRRSPPTRRPAAGVRLTRRGRLAVGVLSALFLLVAVLASGRVTADAGTSLLDQGRATGVVVVQPGESLWGIAQVIAPDADPREIVMAIRDLNGLGDEAVVPGQSLVVPMVVGG
jgi:hypothetical protein